MSKPQSNSTISKRKLANDFFIPVHSIRPVGDISLKELEFNLAMIGSAKLNDIGLKGQNIRVGVIDSGCKQFVTSYKDFTGEGTQDYNGHGTHVVSLIKAIAPDAEMYMAKAMDKTGGGSIPNLIAATLWLKEKGCKIVNCSFAFNKGAQVEVYQKVIDECVKAGMVFCCASGNEGSKEASFPSNKDNVFCVGAIDRGYNITDFSNTGKDVDLVAPGKDILGDDLNNGKVLMSGTSQSTPHVTGMIILYLQYKGNLSFYEIYSDITKRSVKDLGQPGFDVDYGYGLIQPYFAGIMDEPPKKKKSFWQWLKGLFG